MNTRSIYVRLILWYSGLVSAVSLAFGVYTYLGMKERLYSEMEQIFERRANYIAENILTQTQDGNELAQQIAAIYAPEVSSRFIRIQRSDGSLLYLSGTPKDGSFEPGHIPLSATHQKGRWLEKPPSGHDMLIAATPVKVADASYLIEVGMPVDELEGALRGLRSTLFLGLPFVVLLVSSGGYVLVRRSLRPVEAIRAIAEQITFGNLSNRLPVPTTGDPLEQLSVTLNRMLERLETAYQQVSRFSADASHELRTPLTIMRAELESLLLEKLGTGDEFSERVASVLEEAERLSHIAESLLAISRLDAGEANIEHTRLDLVSLVRSTTEQMSLLAEEKSIRIAIHAREAVWVVGDNSRLRQVVANLLDNAIKYTQEHGTVNITVTNLGQKALLLVHDNGIGIPETSLPYVFDRFYRADKVRSRIQGGAGLGLSIVRSICLAHGGTVEIESSEGKGTVCRITLPQADQ